ncbi:hypothetical protein HCN44_009568 [Aphidius gifuensis]|uniref:Uncharacterized protein n=1 Tax=Aphidius gifuensis TaxID=684658 RepID=A0A834Y4V6_APHGI|nr:WD repeat-containing protein 38-like [Aphidius gifuensis]KAF7998170.1 hypothetical protein HCN44_009568 [Aphidius gifuensis]
MNKHDDTNENSPQTSGDSESDFDSQRGSTIIKSRRPSFLTDRRISEDEALRRDEWLQRARLSFNNRLSAKILHKVQFSNDFNGLYCAKFSPSGDVIATTFGTGGIQIRNGETGALKATLKGALPTSLPMMCCRFNPIHENIFYASGACGNIFLCTTDTLEFSRFIEEPDNEINTIDINIDGQKIASGGKDAALRIYDSLTGKLITIYQKKKHEISAEKVENYHRMRIFSVKFHQTYPDLIISGGWDDTVRIWDMRVGTGSIKVIKGPHICGDAIDVRESKILTASWHVRKSLQLWDLTSGQIIDTIEPENRPTTLEGEFFYAAQYFDGDPYGEHIIAGGSGTGAVEVINITTKRVVGSFEVKKAVLTLDSNRTSIVFGGMESIIHLADFS